MVLGLSPPLGDLLKSFNENNSELCLSVSKENVNGNKNNNDNGNNRNKNCNNSEHNNDNFSHNSNNNGNNNYNENYVNNVNIDSNNSEKNYSEKSNNYDYTDNHSTTTLNLFSGNFTPEKSVIMNTDFERTYSTDNSPKSIHSNNSTHFSTNFSTNFSRNFSESGSRSMTAATSVSPNFRSNNLPEKNTGSGINNYRVRPKLAVRSSADRELDLITGKPNLISKKKSEKILR